jgi:hypothetical protein
VGPLIQEEGKQASTIIKLERQLADFNSLESLSDLFVISLLDRKCIANITLMGLQMSPELLDEISASVVRAMTHSGGEVTVYSRGFRFFCFRGSIIVLAMTLEKAISPQLKAKARNLVEAIERVFLEDETSEAGNLSSKHDDFIIPLVYSVLDYSNAVPHVLAIDETQSFIEGLLLSKIGPSTLFLIKDQIDFVAEAFKFTKGEALDAILELKRLGRIKQAYIDE